MSLGVDALEYSGAASAMIGDVLPGVVQVQSGTRGGRGRGAGAGFLWSTNGTVMTNYHVVAGRGRIKVVLADDRSFEAEVSGSSERLDLALLGLRGEPEGLPNLPIGDSDSLRVGELVFAVGHPWGRRGAVTAGIVSGPGTAGRRFGGDRYVWSDAYLAPGNSGGPLVNSSGEVVGVNAMISGGLSLAVPSNTMVAWASGRPGSAQRPRLGVRLLAVTLPPSGRAAGRERGVVIAGIRSDGPAGRAGLLVGDVLLDAAGALLEDAGSLRDALVRDDGGTVLLRLLRGGEEREVEVDFGSPPARSA